MSEGTKRNRYDDSDFEENKNDDDDSDFEDPKLLEKIARRKALKRRRKIEREKAKPKFLRDDYVFDDLSSDNDPFVWNADTKEPLPDLSENQMKKRIALFGKNFQDLNTFHNFIIELIPQYSSDIKTKLFETGVRKYFLYTLIKNHLIPDEILSTNDPSIITNFIIELRKENPYVNELQKKIEEAGKIEEKPIIEAALDLTSVALNDRFVIRFTSLLNSYAKEMIEHKLSIDHKPFFFTLGTLNNISFSDIAARHNLIIAGTSVACYSEKRKIFTGALHAITFVLWTEFKKIFILDSSSYYDPEEYQKYIKNPKNDPELYELFNRIFITENNLVISDREKRQRMEFYDYIKSNDYTIDTNIYYARQGQHRTCTVHSCWVRYYIASNLTQITPNKLMIVPLPLHDFLMFKNFVIYCVLINHIPTPEEIEKLMSKEMRTLYIGGKKILN